MEFINKQAFVFSCYQISSIDNTLVKKQKLENHTHSDSEKQTEQSVLEDPVKQSQENVTNQTTEMQTDEIRERDKLGEETQDDSIKQKDHTPDAGNFDVKKFIKEKFLVDMPEDFYLFWEFCKEQNPKCPSDAFKAVGLVLVGPYDALANKFCGLEEKDSEQYLLHWRYYYDLPEIQTVAKGNDNTGYHIGYFRDSPDELPTFLASNSADKNGVFELMGDNVFAAVRLVKYSVIKFLYKYKSI